MKKFKAKKIKLSPNVTVSVQPSEYKGVDSIQFAKMYPDAHAEGGLAYAKGGFNVPADKWAAFVKLVNAVRI